MSERKNTEEILAELGRKIDLLVDDAKKAGGKISAETEKKIEELKERKNALEADFRYYSSNNNEKWGEARNHLNEAITSLRNAIITVFKS